jgi:GxxExxY protein
MSSIANLRVDVRKSIPLIYKGVHIERAYFADLIVEDAVVVELKPVEALAPIHRQ